MTTSHSIETPGQPGNDPIPVEVPQPDPSPMQDPVPHQNPVKAVYRLIQMRAGGRR